jgi:aspartyl protease/uncharacterized protein DUF4124
MARLVGVSALAAGLVGLWSGPAAAQVYHWTDSDGVSYYTTDPTRIPKQYRDNVRLLDSSPREAEATPPEVGTILFTGGSPILAEAHLNGVPLKLMVDTGADRTVISPSALARAGVELNRGRRVRIIGATGPAEALEVIVPRLDLASAQIGPLPVIMHEIALPGFDGLLGRDVLDGFVVTIDARRGRATLAR